MTKGRLNIARILLTSALIFCTSSASADTSFLHRQLEQFIEQQIQPTLLTGDQFSYRIDPIDQQLNLPQCQSAIDFNPIRPLENGHFSIKASCQSPRNWSLYVRGEITIERRVVIITQALPKGTPLSKEHLSHALINADQLRSGYYVKDEEVLNFELKRPLPQGKVLTPQLLTPPLLVRKNDEVTISAGRKQQFEVRVSGIALQDGRLNQQIRVENLSSGRKIKARVIGRGMVRADY